MIDLHSHLLPRLDDGPVDWEESVAMAEMAHRDGIRTIVATPHLKPGVFYNSVETICAQVQELNRRIASLGLTILAGADISLEPSVLDLIERGDVPMLGTGTCGERAAENGPSSPHASRHAVRYVLLELPPYFLLPSIRAAITRLVRRNVVPIITHPERNPLIGRKPHLLAEMLDAGALSQLTAMSLTGGFGTPIRKLSRRFLTEGMVHVIATDAHSCFQRPPLLSPAVKEAAALVGEAQALDLVVTTPRTIIEGEPLAAGSGAREATNTIPQAVDRLS